MAFLLYMLSAIGVAVATGLLARRLQTAFPELWDDLGNPTWYPRWRGARADFQLMIFVWQSQHVALADRRVSAFVWCARISFVVMAIGVACLVMRR
jgi:hypothetical protein